MASIIECLQFEYHCDVVDKDEYEAGATLVIAKRKDIASKDTGETLIKSMLSVINEDDEFASTTVLKSMRSIEESTANGIIFDDENFIFQRFQNITDHELSLHLSALEANLLSKKQRT